METDKLFVLNSDLPEPLSKKETRELFKQIKENDKYVKTKLAEHNIRLVIHEVMTKFNETNYDKKDLVAVGNIGLVKAINTYDLSKNVEFTTYATKCIDNEILIYIRKNKKDQQVESINQIVYNTADGNEFKIEDVLGADTIVEEEYIKQESYRIIRKIINQLPSREKEITCLYFGFYNNKVHYQQEIADKFSISRAYVSIIIKKVLKKIKQELEEEKIIETKHEKIQKKTTRAF